jgi:ABC-2 type transport system permease protein
VWQSSALGLISLLADREQDFSQEIFVSPISRYSIILGKILGESLVALPQALGIIAFGFILQIHMGPDQLARMVLAMLAIALFGGAFGVIVLANLSSQRAANQIFPFVMLPQFFLAGIFNPIQNLPLPLDILSHLAPMRYAVDLLRDAFYGSTSKVVLLDATSNLAIIGALFAVFMVVGTFLFVRAERNR